jgi:hypothetical protein
MTLIGFTSIFLVRFVVNFVKEKPVSSLNLVDLIYCDVLIWLHLAVSMYLVAILICHFSNTFVIVG